MDLSRQNIEDIYELTPQQKETAEKSPNDSGILVYRLWPLELPPFEQAWTNVMSNHAVLRTSIHQQDLSKPLQVVHCRVPGPFQTLDWRGTRPDELTGRLDGYLEKERERHFSLTNPPLHRVISIRINVASYLVVWHYHSLVLDHPSALTIISDVLSQYERELAKFQFDNEAKQEAQAPPPPLSAAHDREVIRQQNHVREYVKLINKEELVAGKKFWQKSLSGFVVPVVMPSAAISSKTEMPQEDERLIVPQPLVEKLVGVCKRDEVTLSTLISAAWALFLSSASGREDIVFGLTTRSGNLAPAGGKSLVGPFKTIVPARVQVRPEDAIQKWLQTIHSDKKQWLQFSDLAPKEMASYTDLPETSRLITSVLTTESEREDDHATRNISSKLNVKKIRDLIPQPQCESALTVISAANGLKMRLSKWIATPPTAGKGKILERVRLILARIAAAKPNTPLDKIVDFRRPRGADVIGFRSRGDKPPLFCVHPAGGNSLGYASLANRLGPDQTFYAFEANGLSRKEAPLKSIEEMAKSYLEALRCMQPKGPYYLGGWSLGGLVAYEMAVQLKHANEEVGLLALFDTASPSVQITTNSVKPRQILRRFATQFGLDLSNRTDIGKTPIDRLPGLLIAEARASALIPSDFTESMLRRLVRLYRLQVTASQTYQPQAYRGKIHLFRPAKALSASESDTGLGWNQWAEMVEVVPVDGDHDSILREPYVAALAAKLSDRLSNSRDIAMRTT